MKITIEIDSKSELERLSALFKTFDIDALNVVSHENEILPITKGDKKIDPSGLFNIWKKQPRSLEDIRKTGWNRDQAGK